jgi:hypothetical protein
VRQPRVEILYFDDCPNHEPVRELVEQLAAELGLRPQIELVEVADTDAATRLRFLGSPSVRVDERDVEPGADERSDFALSCRVYRSDRGLIGRPEADWIRDALSAAAA